MPNEPKITSGKIIAQSNELAVAPCACLADRSHPRARVSQGE
jgi:hypothetical protein